MNYQKHYKKYVGQEVDVTTLEPSSMSFSRIIRDSGKEKDKTEDWVGRSNADNVVSGKVVEATEVGLVINFPFKRRIYTHDIPYHAISGVVTSELTESGVKFREEAKKRAELRFGKVSKKDKATKA